MQKVIYLILSSFLLFACTKTEVEEIEDFSGDSGTFVDSRDNHVYKWVRIGDQIWMAENLAFLPAVYPPASGSDAEPRYYIYGYAGSDVTNAKQNANYTTYGVLYNWPAAKVSSPPGWHLPSEGEWVELQNYLITNGYNYDGTTTDNKIGKSLASTTLWKTSIRTGDIGRNMVVNNQSGFSGLPGGNRLDEGDDFSSIQVRGFWWSATERNAGYSSSRELFYDINFLNQFNRNKEYGFSVRCVKD